ncbi:GNAT family N-acetyltransferase [Vibrio neptunius]|uniref:GNAT family N-acetyltransferase n=1 Tax=Vibrio neptunius TaxID=170651 RepID=A0ABS3A3F4_9VIBR|nr:GNAT family N-acetyltransferase [Vibrio neptunius]MBN3493578.1 GNAT family N-acetyltransferase [Vibrio neptunius]MBN3516192.1 GNAT family N-acetyltransferase [Vibrio neptunius]MBN3550345.1 GNAT family N-acetyltransferase [Vibrio neptunius]MBN3578379.1 GNAT family N-acetyltransferase [Vibrio neptunius]MCH9872043.1 GNAT family N-acetyltransferase [Vibrio neptunius]
MEFRCKVLKSEDSLKYREVRLESLRLHPECFGSGYEAQAKMPKLYFEGLIESNSQESVMIGAFFDEKLIGLCGLTPSDESSLEIIQMFVFSDFRGHGVAQKLLEKAKSILNNRNEVRLKLTVYSDNTEAIKAYEKSGFIDVSSVENELFMTFEP